MDTNINEELAPDPPPILTLAEEVAVLKNIIKDPTDIWSLRLWNLHHGIEEE